MPHYPTCLSIAGSDPYGGAGIQADLKTFSAIGCYGAAAITALTVQNSRGVRRSEPVGAALVYDQAAAVLDDLRVDALKIGMTVNAGTIRAIARLVITYRPPFVVLDPVMVSSSGHRLLDEDAVAALRSDLMPLCDLVTPNVPELEVLAGRPAPRGEERDEAIRRILDETGCGGILAKGGHDEGIPTDVLMTRGIRQSFKGRRIDTRNTHGTGCTLSSAITAYRAKGEALETAVSLAKRYLEEALEHGAAADVGAGHGAMNHFHTPQPLQPLKETAENA